jgi:hypothetical protein
MGFEQSPHEAAVYRRGSGGNTLLVGVYVDDLVITGTKEAEVAAFKEEMKATFQMSDLGPLSFYLGIEVHQDDSGITLRQTAYAKRIVELAGLTDCNPSLTPMEERLKLSRDSTAEEVDAAQYRRLVGSLRYLAHTRPDLAFSVGYVSRFMQRPTTEHQQAVKRIVRYVAGTLDHDLFYPRCPGEAHFVGYSDNDHAGDIDTSKSTSGILFLASVLSAGSQSSSRWWPFPAAKPSTSRPPPLQLRRSGSLDCSVISLAETLEWWSSEWTTSPLCPWRRTPFSMNGASTFG